MFWKKENETDSGNKKCINSDEYEKLIRRISEEAARISHLENDFKILSTNVDNLRGNFNRKLSGIAKNEEQTKQQETESFINSNEVPFG